MILRLILVGLLSSFTVSSNLGCGAGVLPFLAEAVSVVSTGALWIEKIRSYVEDVFESNPNPALQAEINKYLDSALDAAEILNRGAAGAQDLSKEEIDAAFQNFKEAYKAVIRLTKRLNVYERSGDARLGVTSDGLIVPAVDEFKLLRQ